MSRAPRAFDDGFFHLAAHASDSRYLFLTEADRSSYGGSRTSSNATSSGSSRTP